MGIGMFREKQAHSHTKEVNVNLWERVLFAWIKTRNSHQMWTFRIYILTLHPLQSSLTHIVNSLRLLLSKCNLKQQDLQYAISANQHPEDVILRTVIGQLLIVMLLHSVAGVKLAKEILSMVRIYLQHLSKDEFIFDGNSFPWSCLIFVICGFFVVVFYARRLQGI